MFDFGITAYEMFALKLTECSINPNHTNFTPSSNRAESYRCTYLNNAVCKATAAFSAVQIDALFRKFRLFDR